MNKQDLFEVVFFFYNWISLTHLFLCFCCLVFPNHVFFFWGCSSSLSQVLFCKGLCAIVGYGMGDLNDFTFSMTFLINCVISVPPPMQRVHEDHREPTLDFSNSERNGSQEEVLLVNLRNSFLLVLARTTGDSSGSYYRWCFVGQCPMDGCLLASERL